MLHVTQCKYVDNYRIWVAFNDGTKGIVDLENNLIGPVFAPLQDINFFKQVEYDPTIFTVKWPNGLDLAPEFLQDHLET